MRLPNIGEANWGPKLNDYLENDLPGVVIASPELATTYARRVPLSLTQTRQRQLRAFRKEHRPTGFTNVAATSAISQPDPINLRVQFIAPPSGKVRFRLSASAQLPQNAFLWWSLTDGTAAFPKTEMNAGGNTSGVLGDENRISIEGVISAAPGNGPLIPGNTYTAIWQHRTSQVGQTGYIAYGGTSGAAVMEIIPVEDRLTEDAFAATISAGSSTAPVPLWLSHDRTTLIGTATGAMTVRWSTDDGATWTANPNTIRAGVDQIRELDDGEILVFTAAEADNSKNVRIVKSRGWATNHATATFDEVLVTPNLTNSRLYWHYFSVDVHGSVIVAAPYGPQRTVEFGAEAMARYVYLSEDYGETWQVIFDLATETAGALNAHMHGVCYDPWWDAIWLSNGDGPGVRATWLSLDRGATWRKLDFDQQVVTIKAMPDCILLVSDQASPNAVFRIPRIHPGVLNVETAFIMDSGSTLTAYGNLAYQSRSFPGAPLLLSMQTGGVSSGRLIATYDGYVFREAWKDTLTYSGSGLRTMVGPTLTGKYVGRLDRGDSFNPTVLTLTPPA